MNPPVAEQGADDVSRRVIAAAVGLLEAGSIGRFELPYIANQAAVDVAVVEDGWPDRLQLLIAAWTGELGWQNVVIDTGSLRGDLLAFGHSLRQGVRAPEGRMLFRSSLPIDDADYLADVRMQFWDVQFETAGVIIGRAVRRGELPSEVDPLECIRMFCTAMYFDSLYLDEATEPEYLDSVVDIFLEGVAEGRPGDSAGMRRDVLAAAGARPHDALGEERPAPNYAQATSAQIRQAILDAAIKETTLRGPELVTRSAIARRVGVPIQVVERMWKSDADLLLDAGVRAREKTRPLPDTGSLWADLLSFTEAKANLISAPDARKSYLSAILRSPTGRNASLVREFWIAGLKESTQMCLRAQERGELRDGVNPEHATRIVVASLYYDLFFANAAMRSDYAFTVLDIFLHGAGR